MAWFDQTYGRVAVGTATWNAVTASTAVFNQFEARARAKVVGVLQYAGYASPGATLTDGTDTTEFLRNLCLGVYCKLAFRDRKGVKFPSIAEDALDDLKAVYEKRLPVPGMTPDTTAGYGGGQFSPSSGTDGRPQVFGRKPLTGY